MALLMQQLLLLFCTVTYGGNIDCLAWQSCLGQTKHCVDVTNGEKCVVTCGGPAGSSESCMNTIINCENGVACEVHCNRYKSCYGATINANQATTLTVTTSSIDGEIDLLYNADIYCGNTNFCDITCSNKDNQCYGLYVNAESAGQLVVRCDGDQNNHCQYSQFYCPKTTATCWIFGPAAMHNIDIYSEMGFDAVQLCGIPNTGIEPFGTMHCALGYTQSCNIHQSAPNQCDTTTSTSCHHINPSIDLTCIPPVPTMPTTTSPTTAIPTTAIPTTAIPTTSIPTTSNPTTSNPTTSNPTTSNPTKIVIANTGTGKAPGGFVQPTLPNLNAASYNTVMECNLPNTDPASCAGRITSFQNAQQNFKLKCSNSGACASSTLNFTYVNSMVE
eukprot:974127_1